MLAAAGAGAGLTGVALVTAVQLLPTLAGQVWLYPAFFLLSVAHAGVRLGRKTYPVDLASGDRRTDYVAVSNAVIGVVLLVAGSVGVLTPFVSISGVLLILAAMGLAGAWLTLSLPEAST